MKLTGRVRHRTAHDGPYKHNTVLALQVEVLCSQQSPEDFRKGVLTTQWIDARVEHLSEINVKGELK